MSHQTDQHSLTSENHAFGSAIMLKAQVGMLLENSPLLRGFFRAHAQATVMWQMSSVNRMLPHLVRSIYKTKAQLSMAVHIQNQGSKGLTRED